MIIIGHRGARGIAPENTLISIQKAIDNKVDEIEFDLRVTKDNFVILQHNKVVTSRSGQKLIVKDSKLSDLKRHKPDLATLEELLEMAPKSALLYIEVKP